MNTDIAIYLVLCISALSLILTVYALIKIKLLVYLIDQPEVKKLASGAKLKLKKIDRKVIEDKKPSKPRNYRTKSGGHQGGHQGGKDNRNQKGQGRNDRYKDRKGSRPQRGVVRGDKPRGTVVANQPANEDNKPVATKAAETSIEDKGNSSNQQVKTEVPKKDQTNGQSSQNSESSNASKGRRPLPARGEQQPAAAPAPEAPAPAAEQSQPDTQVSSGAPSNTDPEIQHGRRTRIKKSPTFEE